MHVWVLINKRYLWCHTRKVSCGCDTKGKEIFVAPPDRMFTRVPNRVSSIKASIHFKFKFFTEIHGANFFLPNSKKFKVFFRLCMLKIIIYAGKYSSHCFS